MRFLTGIGAARRVRVLVVLALLAVPLALPLASAQDAPVDVEVEAYVLTLGNYDVTKGTYTVDYYLTLRWNASAAPPGFTAANFELQNGRSSATTKISDETDPTTGVREINYRILAPLASEPHFESYPYDTQRLVIAMEDQTHGSDELRYVPVADASGLDADAKLPGWRFDNVTLDVVQKTYPPDEKFDRVRFVVTISREPLSSTIKAFLPPLAFMLVAGLAFFFHPSKVANRLTLGTGMLIAAVGFHISQTVGLPPIGSLILFDKVMIATYAFHVGGLVTSTLIHIDEDYWKDRDYTTQINLWGAAFSLLLFAGVLGLLVYVF